MHYSNKIKKCRFNGLMVIDIPMSISHSDSCHIVILAVASLSSRDSVLKGIRQKNSLKPSLDLCEAFLKMITK